MLSLLYPVQLQELTNNAAEYARLWIGRGKRAASRGIVLNPESCDGRLIVTRVKPYGIMLFLIIYTINSCLKNWGGNAHHILFNVDNRTIFKITL